MRYLLDAVLSDFARSIPAVLARLRATRKGETAICTATAMEIEYGLMLNSARARKIEPMILSLLQDLHVFSYGPEDATATAAVRAALAKRGTFISRYDVMIAEAALRHARVMVMSKGGESARIDGLILEDWRASRSSLRMRREVSMRCVRGTGVPKSRG